MSSKIRILLAEDHETVREGLKMIIDTQSDMETVGVAGNGEMAVALAQQLKPDIVVMDISMPGLNGSRATKRIIKSHPKVGIVALTRHKESGYVHELLRAGAAGYVLKQSAPEEFLRAIRAVKEGKSYLDPAVTAGVLKDFTGRQLAHAKNLVDLTEREAEVLRLIAAGYSNKEIAGQLQVSVKTVEAHKANSMKKLNFTSRTEIVNYALLRGWLGTN